MSTTKTVTVQDLSKKAHLKPKQARSILRRTKGLPKTVGNARWVFKSSDAPKVLKVLKAA